VDENLEACSFDLARLNLQLAAEGEPARERQLQMSKLFDAQLANSKAHAFAGKADYEKALPFFEQVLELADSAKERERFPLDSAIVGLAGSYFRLGRFQDFNLLYDKRFGSVTVEWVKYILNNQRQTVQLYLGHAAAGRGEYDEALNALLPAYKLDMHNVEIIGAIVAAYIRSNRLIEAGSFLEQAEPRLAREADRKEIAGAIAMVNFLKARNEEKAGKFAEAEAHLRTSVSRNPEIAAFWVALARQRHKAGSFEEARKLLQEGLEHVKDDQSRNEIVVALEKIQQIETIMKSVR
jgi:tetratricopeptide (TPR) repeat protein